MQDYLESLNKKPAKQPSLQWDKFDELDDLDQQIPPATVSGVGSSKFIKKRIEPGPQTQQAGDAALPSALGSASARSSALGKAQSFAAKFGSARVSRVRTRLSSDSSDDLSLSPDQEVLADTKALRHTGSTSCYVDTCMMHQCYVIKICSPSQWLFEASN